MTQKILQLEFGIFMEPSVNLGTYLFKKYIGYCYSKNYFKKQGVY